MASSNRRSRCSHASRTRRRTKGHWQEAWQAVQVQARALIAQLADEYTLHS
jgi:hypothetical protein